ncbi:MULTISPECIES: archaetidylserine decarboxylase [Methylococcus]|uniref:Phosphatidylserine decarboxylase proenzyme n=1 Tax=Methylococcus capsulatus TaxID=414 RepID=A0ABZ2F5G7_METCP|nr:MULTISPECIES: archaetidylserine decarboxylase [Methylococcus]MDF9391654.1 phosphatidylserine decarboxylase [Methylococcus capsulatus]
MIMPPSSSKLFASLQYLLPQHGLSRLMHRVVRIRRPWFKNAMIRTFCKLYRVDLTESICTSPDSFECFNSFFTRALKPGVRPICSEPDGIACPADGVISQIGAIEGRRLFQAKGHCFELAELLGGDDCRTAKFENGSFATVYLSPRDYHRVHLPVAGTLAAMVHVPGALFSVNVATTENIPNLFARNERVICYFDTVAGPMAVILVGAIFVSSIETVWYGEVTPPRSKTIRRWDYSGQGLSFERGAEIGRFNMGSTVIVLFGAGHACWRPEIEAGLSVKMGMSLGSYR